jgi:abhydrolase domain-containing protein 12
MTVWTKGRNFLIVLGACYVIFIACLLQPNVQRNIFYLHRVRWSLKNHGNPAKYGFNSKRAQSFFINDTLHAWHIAPVPHARSANKAASMHLDNSHQLIIYLHGTALTLTASHRLTSYRIFTALPDTHLLAIDYRGFGLSLGVPSENGLIEDGVAAVHWALERGFAKERITLYGQSLGSAVAIGVAHRLAIETQPPIELAKVVTIAAFESGSEIIKTYRLGGVVPILEPLRTYPFVQKWLTDRLQHQWNSLA